MAMTDQADQKVRREARRIVHVDMDTFYA